MEQLKKEIEQLLENSQNSTWERDSAWGRTEQLKRSIILLAEAIDRLNERKQDKPLILR